MQNPRSVAAVITLLLCGSAHASNLVLNGDFPTDLSGWTGGGAGDASMAWTNTAPDGGGIQMNGVWESIYTTSYVFSAADEGKQFYVSFDAGSPDQTAAGTGLLVRLSQHVDWMHTLVPGAGYAVSAAQLNAGFSSYQGRIFTVPPSITPGDTLELWFDTYGSGLSGANHVVVDNVVVDVYTPGDLNGDTFIDLTDYAVLKSHWLQSVTGGPFVGDLNSDGVVALVDFSMFKDYYIAFNGGGAELPLPVPEPGSLLLLTIAVTLAPVVLRRKRNT
jgi:hypothetical protein